MFRRMLVVLLVLSCGSASADYISDREAAIKLKRARKYEEALAAFEDMAEGDVSDFQRSDALEQAAACARSLEKFDRARQLAERIPIEAVSKTVQMQNLVAQRKFEEVVKQFKDEKIDTWPAYAAVKAYAARGQAHLKTGHGKAAEEDLSKAVALCTDKLERARNLALLAHNRETNLKDREKALDAYFQIVEMKGIRGNSRYFHGVLNAARILRERGEYDKAVQALEKMAPRTPSGYWYGRRMLAVGKTLVAAGRKDEAVVAYRELLADEKTHPGHRKTAKEAIERLGSE